MEEIIEYYTLVEPDADALDHAVNKGIEEGFQPFGQPYLSTSDQEHMLYHQAMVRRAEPAQAVALIKKQLEQMEDATKQDSNSGS